MPYHWPTEEIHRSSLDLDKLPFPPFSQTPPLLLALPGRKGLGLETRRPPGLGRGLPWSLSPRQLPPATGRRAGRCPRSPHTSVPRDGLEILTLSFYFSHLGNVRRGHSRNNCAPTDTTHTQNPPASAARGPRRRASGASRCPPIRPPRNDAVVSPKHPSPHRWRPARCTDTAGHLSAASAAARAVNSAHRVVSSGARCGGSTLFRVLTLTCNDFSRCGTRGHRFRAHTPAPWLHQDGVRTPPPFDSGTFSLPPRDQSPHRQLPRAPATTALRSVPLDGARRCVPFRLVAFTRQNIFDRVHIAACAGLCSFSWRSNIPPCERTASCPSARHLGFQVVSILRVL